MTSLLSRFGSIIVAAMLFANPSPAAAQNLFAPVVTVNGAAITEFEVQQRQRFLQILNAPGATRKAALDALIEERLHNEAIGEAGLKLSEEAIAAGLTEFAGRADLSTEEFVAALGQAGISRETFRDFVVSGLAWRDLVRARYAPRVQITEAEIDRALAAQGVGTNIRVLVSEIIIPAPPQRAAQVQALAEEISQTRSIETFASYARKYSATASRGRGGRLEWTPINQLPPAIQPLILALAPGEVTQPLPIPNAVALFQLRAIEETGAPTRDISAIEYAAYYIAGGRTEAALQQAARVAADVDVCDDLYAIAKGQPPEVLERVTKKPAEISNDIAIELSKLDPGETSTLLTRNNGQTLMLLMMCGRTNAANAEVDREAVANSLRQSRLAGYAKNLTEQLRADARIVQR